MTAELTYLQATAKDWQRKMQNSKLGRSESIFSLRNVLLRQLVYPLPATTMTQEECNEIMSPILTQGLPSAGFVRTFPYALAHGPLKLCGINIPNLFTEQTLTHIQTLLKFSNQPQDLTGFLLRATGESMRLEIGLSGSLFKAPLILQDLITDSWMKHTWITTRKANIQVQADIPDFQLNRYGDKELVRAFLQNGFRQPQLAALHWCQMHLQVLRLSDLTTGMGDRLLTNNWKEYKPLQSEYTWPKAAKPSTSDWHIWDLALEKAFQAGRNQRLPYPLGDYLPTSNEGWYYDTIEQSLWFVLKKYGDNMGISPPGHEPKLSIAKEKIKNRPTPYTKLQSRNRQRISFSQDMAKSPRWSNDRKE